ncbi:N-ethylammeline chlorohydrolase [Candidatus Micrarchaeota archaeon CG10_big_fil_rev_8_21_14_0_10_45_29]|nr:MAG: N-ethylammeline chlorohydrolase [Candidatus Micrarchaeota archaeon CG10_big_fil_rev_8_21_14_0_10_45_29]
MPILLKNALILLGSKPCKFRRASLLIENNKISSLNPKKLPKEAQIIDCSKKIVLPGLINAHTHSPMSILRGIGDDLPLAKWLKEAMWPREKKLSPSDIKTGASLAICEMLRNGTTCFSDHYFHMDSVADAAKEAGIRAVLGYSMIDMGNFEERGKSELKIADAFAKKIKEMRHSLLTPSINPHAINTCSKELLENSATLAKKYDCVLHIHAAETRAELSHSLKTHKLRPIQLLEKCGCLTKNTVLAHGVYVTKGEISQIAKKGASVCTCPVSNLKLASGGAPPIPQYLHNKVNLCIGTDGAASNNSLSLFESAKVGAIEQKNFHFDASAIKADDYLHMLCEGGAKALKINAGKIKEGALADIILLDANSSNLMPFSNNAGWLIYSAGSQNISDVIINGEFVMKERQILFLNEEKIFEAAQKIAERIN